MDISKKITLKLDERETHTKGMEDLLAAAEAEERGLNEDEQKDFDSHESMIKTIDIEVENLERMERAVAAQKAKPAAPKGEGAPRVEVNEVQDPKHFFARQAHALYMTGGSRGDAAAYAKSLGDDSLAKVLSIPEKSFEMILEKATTGSGTTGDAAWAGPLTTVMQASSAFVEMLRSASIVARFPGRQMAFGGDNQIDIPRQTAGEGGTWIGENAPIRVGKLAFDTLTLTPKKTAVIVPSTAELLRKSSPSAMMLITDDIVAGTAKNVDTKFVSDDAVSAGVSPAGLINGIAGTASAGATLANVDTDLSTLTGSLLGADVPMTSPVWIMNPVNVNFLAYLRDGGGNRAYPEVLNGTLVGFPIIQSTAIAKTSIIFTDAPQVVIASDYMPMIDVSEDATLVMEDTDPVPDISSEILATTEANRIQSMYQHDAVAIRVKMAIDWIRRHDVAVDHLHTVAWVP